MSDQNECIRVYLCACVCVCMPVHVTNVALMLIYILQTHTHTKPRPSIDWPVCTPLLPSFHDISPQVWSWWQTLLWYDAYLVLPWGERWNTLIHTRTYTHTHCNDGTENMLWIFLLLTVSQLLIALFTSPRLIKYQYIPTLLDFPTTTRYTQSRTHTYTACQHVYSNTALLNMI